MVGFNDPQAAGRLQPMAEPAAGKGKLVATVGVTAAAALLALVLVWLAVHG